MDILHPVDIGLGETLRHEFDGTVLHHANSLFGKRRHLHEPLGGDQRFHVVMAAIAGTHIVAVRLSLDQIAGGVQILHNGLAALVAIHSLILAAVFVDGAVISNAADDLQIVAQAHLEVVGVMGRRHLHGAGTEADLAVFVAHDGDLTIHQRQNALLAYEVLELLVLRVDGHAGIAQHGFGTGGGDDDIAAAIAEGIADIPQMAGLFGVLHLGVGQGGQAMGAPVDDAASLVDQAFFIQFAESLPDGTGAALVHGETIAAPITGSAHLLLLLHDAASVFFLPRPDALQELLTAQIMAGQTFCVAQILFHLDLGGNAGVVTAGQPQCLIALHPFVPD